MKNRVEQGVCRQCGTCCKKNGPALHKEDWPLVEKGLIPLSHLYTLRAGEMAHDNVRGTLEPVPADVIKIKGKSRTRACLYLDDMQANCTVYHQRPAECRALKCWDTQDIEVLYTKDRLDRKTILKDKPEFWGLVQDHQQRCDYGKLEKLIVQLEGPHHEKALQSLSEIIHYDRNIRTLLVEQTNIDPDICDFLFGRPLTNTLAGYGIKFNKAKSGGLIVQLKNNSPLSV